MLDPRIEPLFRNDPPGRFLALALCTILSKIGDKPGGVLEEVIAEFKGKTPDWREEVVPGRSLLTFNGKSVMLLVALGENPNVINKVIAMYEARGLEFPIGKADDLAPNLRRPGLENEVARYQKQATGPSAAFKPGPAPAPTENVNSNPNSQTPPPDTSQNGDQGPTNGSGATGNAQTTSNPGSDVKIAGRPLSEYAGKSDEEILAMENVGQATLKKIREAQATATG